jgi:hypothetical protein
MNSNATFDGSGQTHIFTSFPESHQGDEQNVSILTWFKKTLI